MMNVTMNDPGMGRMTGGIGGRLGVVLPVLAVFALVKYLRSK
jgi:hypothetical protein